MGGHMGRRSMGAGGNSRAQHRTEHKTPGPARHRLFENETSLELENSRQLEKEIHVM